MIHYQLQCRDQHLFDGWFRDSAAFEVQAAKGLVECPICAGTDVVRAPMAPALARRIAAQPTPVPPAPAPTPATSASPTPAAPTTEMAVAEARMPDQVRAALQRLRAEVERRCDYVGERFAAEARRMHSGEIPPRGIYGEATPAQAEALVEDGIEVARIPWVPRADG
jgi:hypothetical protein